MFEVSLEVNHIVLSNEIQVHICLHVYGFYVNTPATVLIFVVAHVLASKISMYMYLTDLIKSTNYFTRY